MRHYFVNLLKSSFFLLPQVYIKPLPASLRGLKGKCRFKKYKYADIKLANECLYCLKKWSVCSTISYSTGLFTCSCHMRQFLYCPKVITLLKLNFGKKTAVNCTINTTFIPAFATYTACLTHYCPRKSLVLCKTEPR